MQLLLNSDTDIDDSLSLRVLPDGNAIFTWQSKSALPEGLTDGCRVGREAMQKLYQALSHLTPSTDRVTLTRDCLAAPRHLGYRIIGTRRCTLELFLEMQEPQDAPWRLCQGFRRGKALELQVFISGCTQIFEDDPADGAPAFGL